jgi:hypothetical protein
MYSSYYNCSQYSCFRNVSVQISLITIKANIHASQERLCTVLSYYHYSQYSTLHPSQERLCTVLSY